MIVDTSDKKRVVAVAEDGTPVTGAMVDCWCDAYDRGELPDGYGAIGCVTIDENSAVPKLHPFEF